MKENEVNVKRIVRALRNRAEDRQALKRIAIALDYLPEQLKQDIQALDEFITRHEEQEDEI